MREIQDGDVCTACGARVRRTTTETDSLSGESDRIHGWTCDCDSLAGPQVDRSE